MSGTGACTLFGSLSTLWAQTGAGPENLSIFDPVSPPAASIKELFLLVLAITGGIFLLVEVLLIYFMIRFRRGREPDGTEPPQVYGSKPIEIAWTVAPSLIVFVLILTLARTEYEVRIDPNKPPPPGSEPLKVTVVGHQWWWEYDYETFGGEKLGFIAANELHVPVSEPNIPRPVYLTLKSADVCHSFWVPRLAGKTDLIPAKTNFMWFQTEKPGLYLGQCAEYCGTQHANMLLRVYVDSPGDFRAWLDNQKGGEAPQAAQSGQRRAFFSVGCISCHRIGGTRATGTKGPDLTHLMSRQTLAAGMVPNNRDQLYKWVVDPNAIKPGCNMPAMQLAPDQVDQVVDYLRMLD